MIVLKDQQKQRFSQDRRDRYIEEVVGYIWEKDRFHAETIGEDGIRKVVQLGMKRAQSYQVTQESSLKLYVHLMFYLGSYFDVDPLLPWAKKELTSKIYGSSQPNRMNALRAEFLSYLEKTSGKHGEHLQGFLKSCRTFVENPSEIGDANAILEFIKDNYAPYVVYSGEDILRDLIGDCERRTKNADMHDMRSALILTILRIVYGVGVTDDPLFPWVKKVFEKDSMDKDALFWKLSLEFMRSVEKHIEEKANVR